jgi:uncharacterized membrane protein YcjF (UPF0283 family)
MRRLSGKSIAVLHHQQDGDDDSVVSSESGREDDRSSKTGSFGFVGDQQHLQDEANEERGKVEQLIERETKEVAMWRNLLALMLVSTAALVTYFSYRLLQKEYQRNFDIGVSTIHVITIQKYFETLSVHVSLITQ